MQNILKPPLPLFSLSLFTHEMSDHFKQACTTYGQRSKCDPRMLSIWTVKLKILYFQPLCFIELPFDQVKTDQFWLADILRIELCTPDLKNNFGNIAANILLTICHHSEFFTYLLLHFYLPLLKLRPVTFPLVLCLSKK